MPPSGLTITLPPLQRPEVAIRVSSIKRGDLHKREEQIRSPDGPTTLIGGKKRKRRTVDEENLSDSEPDSIKTLAKTDSDLNYFCKIDTVSETEIVDAVQSINYSVDNLVSNIMDGVKKFKLSYHKASPRKHRDIPTDRDLGIPKLQSLLKYSQQSVDEKDLVVEAMLHNVITSLIHAHYFKGGHFFGVGPETHHEFLETMFSKLVADENLDLTAIQRWRSMSVQAVFQMNDGIESQLYHELVTELKCMLKATFALSPRSKESTPESNYKSIVYREQKSLLDVIRQARKLSFMIQQVISCQLLVTVDHSPSKAFPDDEELSTSFGLQRILGRDRTVLIRSKFLTSELLQSHLH